MERGGLASHRDEPCLQTQVRAFRNAVRLSQTKV